MKLPKIKSYREFLKTYGEGESVEDIYSAERKKALMTYDKSKSTYAQNAERLASQGLSGSGYAGYLDDVAKANHQNAMAAIAHAKAQEEQKRYASYEDYLDSMRKEQDSLEGQVHRTILSSRTIDTNEAMRVAQIYGLSGSAAKNVVDYAVRVNIERKKEDILDKIRTERTSPERAAWLGEMYGLPEEIIGEIRAFAQKLYGVNALMAKYQNYNSSN